MLMWEISSCPKTEASSCQDTIHHCLTIFSLSFAAAEAANTLHRCKPVKCFLVYTCCAEVELIADMY